MVNLIKAYARAYTINIFRNRSAAFFSVLFPAILMLMFGHPGKGASQSDILQNLIVFANYAVQSVALLILGMAVSSERNSDWVLFLRTLPVSPGIMIVGRTISILLLAILSLILVLMVSSTFLNIHLSFKTQLLVGIFALIGGIPMALLGTAVGNLINAATARSVFVLLNLALLFGSFSLPDHGTLSLVREFIPTYQWLMMANDYLTSSAQWLIPLAWLLGYTILFYLLAIWSMRRRRNTRFS